MADYSLTAFAAAILELLRGPKFSDREFVRSGATFGEVYAMAANLGTAHSKEYTAGRSADCCAMCNRPTSRAPTS